MVRRTTVAGLVALLVVPAAAVAQSVQGMRKEVQASMLVTGTIDIGRDGHVAGHPLDQPAKLPEHVTRLLARALPSLRFAPVLVDGAAMPARSRMSLRLMATPTGDGSMTIALQSAHFGDAPAPGRDAAGGVVAIDMRPPTYPRDIVHSGGKGTVYVLLRLGADGKVADAAVEQVNLTTIGNSLEMHEIRSALARATLGAARRWAFRVPAGGAAVVPFVRVPVQYAFDGDVDPPYGTWIGYHPGPRTRSDWAPPEDPGFSPDALAAGGIHSAASTLRLLTPLGG